MYKLIVTTKYNVIELYVDIPEQIAEILTQPWVVSIKVEKALEKEQEQGGKTKWK